MLFSIITVECWFPGGRSLQDIGGDYRVIVSCRHYAGVVAMHDGSSEKSEEEWNGESYCCHATATRDVSLLALTGASGRWGGKCIADIDIRRYWDENKTA